MIELHISIMLHHFRNTLSKHSKFRLFDIRFLTSMRRIDRTCSMTMMTVTSTVTARINLRRTIYRSQI